MKRPADHSNLDTALMIVSAVAWLVSFIDHDAGHTQRAWGEIGVAYLLFFVFFIRETRRYTWMVRP